MKSLVVNGTELLYVDRGAGAPLLFAARIVGQNDVISPPAEMRGIAEAIPDAQFVEIPAAGHMAPLENPAAVNVAILEFLATV